VVGAETQGGQSEQSVGFVLPWQEGHEGQAPQL
jgi:hypothetical protein